MQLLEDKQIAIQEINSIDLNNNVLYTINEIAKLLKVNKNYVYELIDHKLLKSIKLGCRKVTKTSLLDFVNKYDGYDLSDMDNPIRL